MTVSFIKRHAKLMGCIALLISTSQCSSVSESAERKSDEVKNANALWNGLTWFASDHSGSYPHSVNELLAVYWELGESMVYDDQGEVMWEYPINDQTRQTSRGDQVLFRSAKEIDGAVLEVTVDSSMMWRERSGQVKKQEVPEDLELKYNTENEGFPRFIVVLGDTRLSFYKTWTKEDVLKRIKIAQYSYGSDRLFLVRAGRLESYGRRAVASDEWYLDEEKGKWRFEEFAFSMRKSAEMRVVSKDFDSMQEAVDWYVREKIEPLLNDETN